MGDRPGLGLQDALDFYSIYSAIPGLKDRQSTPLITESGTRATLRILVSFNTICRLFMPSIVFHSGLDTSRGLMQIVFTSSIIGSMSIADL